MNDGFGFQKEDVIYFVVTGGGMKLDTLQWR